MPDIRIVPGNAIMSFTSSLNFIEKITQDASGSLNLYGSGSTGRTELFSIDGNNGRLFTVSDDLSDSLFSVNTIAGLPVIEAFANNSVNIGQYSAPPIKVTGSQAIITGSLNGGADFSRTSLVFNESTNATRYLVFAPNGNGAPQTLYTDLSDLTYNPSTNVLTAGTFSGALSGNASTATTLANTRTIWGQNFNGSANVTGNLTSVGDITGTSAVTLSSTNDRLTLSAGGANKISFLTNGSERWLISSAGILESSGAQTLRTSTGNLTLATAAGNGNLVITPHGTGTTSITNGGISYNSSVGTSAVNGEIAYWGGGTVAAGNLYYYDSSGNWTAADADAESTSTGLLGIALAAGTASTVGILLRGHARFTANSLYTGITTVGAKLYVSTTAGEFTQTAPSGTGDVVRVIGYVQSTSADQIYFCPDNTWVTLV